MKKKLFSISTLLFLFLLITLNSCRQELDVIANQTNKEREAEFFSTAKNNSQTGKISTNQDLIIDILKKDNEQSHFVSKLDDKKGLPVWNSMLIQKNKNSSAKGVSGSEKTILIPLTEDGDFLSSYIVASINANNEITHLENVTNKELYEFVHNKSIPKDIRETALGNIIYTNNKVFGFKKFINIPEDLFTEIPLDKGKDTKTIKFVEKKSSSSMASRTEMELLCYSYEADDPSCSCHGTIIISKCFYVLVEYGGGGSTGDSGDSTGGSTSGGGGSSGSGSTTNNTPWYLMNPDIDIYSYNPTIKGVFKSMTDQGFVLQKEHVDFLQENITLANTIRNVCLTNNTAYKSLFVYNLLDDYAFASPTPDVNVLNNKLNNFYLTTFTYFPKANWGQFFSFFNGYGNTSYTPTSYTDYINNNRTIFDIETGDFGYNNSGTYDTTPIDNYDLDNQQNPWPTIAPVIPLADFVGWRKQKKANGEWMNCMDFCVEQLAKKNYSVSGYYEKDLQGNAQRFQIYTEQNGVNLNDIYKGVKYLIYALSNGIPVVVGIDDKNGDPGNLDKTTDHFVVIVGMGQDTGGRYFQFYDNASSNPAQGASPLNKLYVTYPSKKITGKTQCSDYRDRITEHNYIITQIRKTKL